MKNLTSNEKKLTAIIIVLALALVSLTVYIITDKNKNDNNNINNEVENNDKPSEEKVEDLDINSEEVKELYALAKMKEETNNIINSYSYDNSLEECIYEQKESKPKDLDCNILFVYRLNNFIQNKNYNFEYNKSKNQNNGTDNIEIKKSELEKVLYKLYGNNYTIDDLNSYIADVIGNDSYIIKYDKDQDTYKFNISGGFIASTSIETKLIKAEKDKDYIYLYEKVGLSTNSKKKYFSNMIGLSKDESDENKFIEKNKDKAKDLNGKSIWDYENNLSTFKFVFKKDKNGEYHLESMGYVEIK